MWGAEKTRFLVLVTDGTKVTTDDLKVCVLSDVVLGHLEHAKVKVCDRAERAAGHQHDWSLLGIAKSGGKPVVRELVVRRVGEVLRRTRHSGHGGWYREREGEERAMIRWERAKGIGDESFPRLSA